MPRSNAVREEALRLDGSRCQITGADAKDGALLEVHHVIALGMGGSTELDAVENCITLEASIHQMVESGALVIARWERGLPFRMRTLPPHDNPNVFAEIGQRMPELEVIDNQDVLGHGIGKVDHSLLWFYRRKDAEELEEVEATIQGVHKADGGVAYALWRLWKNDAFKMLDPDAKSFKAYCEARDWRTSSCEEMAETYDLSKEKDFEWLTGETMRAFKTRARAAGIIGNREYFYVKIPHRSWLLGSRPEVYYRTAYEQELRETMEIGDRLYKLAKTVYGLRAESGRLIRPDGSEEPFIRFVPKEK